MGFITFILCIFICFSSLSQQKDIDVLVDQNGNIIAFNAVNYTNIQQEVTLEIDTVALDGYRGSVTKLVQANDTVPLTRLSIAKNAKWEYTKNFTYRPKPTDSEIKAQKETIRSEMLQSLNHSESRITIFVGEGCSRSKYAELYMKRKNIPFNSLEVNSNDFYNRVMWELLKLEEPDIKRVTFPVFLIEDTIVYNIDGIQKFVKTLRR